MAAVACLALINTNAMAQSGGLYKPAKKGNANVEFGNQSMRGASGNNRGHIQKRPASRYYTERCLKPGPIIHCSASGKCVERTKPAVCAKHERETQKIAAIEPKGTQESAMSRVRQRRAEEEARRRAQQVRNDGKTRAGEVRITPLGHRSGNSN